MNRFKIFNLKKKWVKKNIKNVNFVEKEVIFKYLFLAHYFEKIMSKKFFSKKRFSIEGCEILIPFIFLLIKKSKTHLVFSMSHRGRLNVLYNIFKYNFTSCSNFQDEAFHLGAKRIYKNKKIVILPNPSHLEYSNCVSMGYTRSLIENGLYTINIQIHGDCSISGQGIVMETFNLSKLRGYKIKGTLHIIINNNIGFTTSKTNEIRSSDNCDSIIKMFNIPTFRVFYNNINSLIKILKLSLKYIKCYKSDVLINLTCYRKLGHSEQDNAKITQPVEYNKIKKIKPLYKHFKELNNKKFKKKIINRFNRKKTICFLKSEKYNYNFNKAIKNKFFYVKKIFINLKNKIKKIGNIHVVVKTFLKNRIKCFKNKKFDWSTGEFIALHFLNFMNYKVRISGQDSQRGTFCQRHYNIYDQKTGKEFCIFDKKCTIINSPLSEASILGYELGYSICNCDNNYNSVNFWEAQFGDFSNCAQVYFDQYISCLNFKWNIKSNITILLPHGLEGNGPEHSSSRLERIMSLCSKNNIIVLCPNSSSQYFNCIIEYSLKKVPKIILTKKNVRNKNFYSNLSLFSGKFKKYKILNRESNVCIICNGDIYYEIKKYKNINIFLLEQLYPLNFKDIKSKLSFMKIKSYYWAQYEPKNQGYWTYINSVFNNISKIKIKYLGLPSIPSTTFFGKKFFFEKKILLKKIKKINEKKKC